jgi:hypothetical protein
MTIPERIDAVPLSWLTAKTLMQLRWGYRTRPSYGLEGTAFSV